MLAHLGHRRLRGQRHHRGIEVARETWQAVALDPTRIRREMELLLMQAVDDACLTRTT